MNEKTLEEARKAIDKLAAKGLINSPDYWKERLEESFPVWAYFIIEGNKLEG